MRSEHYRERDRSNMEKFIVVPDYWKSSWGDRPVLGVVYANNAFEGERMAYDKGLLRVNFTFKPKLIPAKPNRSKQKP